MKIAISLFWICLIEINKIMHSQKSQLQFFLTTLRKKKLLKAHKTLQYFHFLFHNNPELSSGMRLESTVLIMFQKGDFPRIIKLETEAKSISAEISFSMVSEHISTLKYVLP